MNQRNMAAAAIILGAIIAAERFYSHPTFGTGIRALLAAIQAGELFA